MTHKVQDVLCVGKPFTGFCMTTKQLLVTQRQSDTLKVQLRFV